MGERIINGEKDRPPRLFVGRWDLSTGKRSLSMGRWDLSTGKRTLSMGKRNLGIILTESCCFGLKKASAVAVFSLISDTASKSRRGHDTSGVVVATTLWGWWSQQRIAGSR